MAEEGRLEGVEEGESLGEASVGQTSDAARRICPKLVSVEMSYAVKKMLGMFRADRESILLLHVYCIYVLLFIKPLM